ncbi:MAG: ABC transporter ATP-binding protein [Nitrosarchaeum sp.]|nr:ABC transporter ATP-binding protein [Nitrosarchaeum sp.]
MTLLSVADLSARYSTSSGFVYAVDAVNFDLNSGESMGIAGESACGKSTLGLSIIKTLLGGIATGRIEFHGKSLLDMDESEFDRFIRWKEISMIFQGAMNSLDPVFTIRNQFLELLNQHGFKGDKINVINNAVESVGLNQSVLSKYPHQLSGGMKQRVIIALALILKPKIVIADEPTTALDVLTQSQIINMLKKLKNDGMSFMFITHDLAVLSEMADKIGIMYGGQMIEFGTSHEIYKDPKHPYTKALLDSIPRLRGGPPKYIPGVPPSLLDPPTQCRFIERCPLAVEKCKQVPPEFQTHSGYVRCWLYE